MKTEKIHNESPNQFSYGVIGGGIAGCTTALKLANNGHSVHLFESEPELLSKTSDATPCRLNMGFHYMHLPTAISNLEASVALIKNLKKETGCTFQVPNSPAANDSGTKRINYVISKNSLVPTDTIIDIFEALKNHYSYLISQDAANEVFGKVDSFYKIVDKKKFKGVLNIDKIQMVFDTCETLFDWPKFKKYLIKKLHSHPNIVIHLNTLVKSIKPHSIFKTELVTASNDPYFFNTIINSSWHNVDKLNQTMGYCSGKNTNNRVKCMAIVQLPKSLEDKSFLVGYGPYCALSSRPDGTGYLTYEPATNIDQFDSENPRHNPDKFIHENSTPEKKLLRGKRIIVGASDYIPDLTMSEFLDLKIGVVRNDNGRVNINKKDKHFERVDRGVYPVNIGLIVNEARKHTYWYVNSEEVIEVIKNLETLKNYISQMLENINKSLTKVLKKPFMISLIGLIIASHFIDKEYLGYLQKQWLKEARRYASFFNYKKTITDNIKEVNKKKKSTNNYTL